MYLALVFDELRATQPPIFGVVISHLGEGGHVHSSGLLLGMIDVVDGVLAGPQVDPFPHDGKVSLWRAGDTPKPFQPEADPGNGCDPFSESQYVEEQVRKVVSACLTRSTRERLQKYTSLYAQAGHTIAEMNYYPTRFTRRVNLYAEEHPRASRLDLPFSREDFDGVVFADELS